MSESTISSLVPAIAAILGSLVGGLSSFTTTYFSQRQTTYRDRLAKELANSEKLYVEFIKEATNLYIDSLDKRLDNPHALINLYSLIGRIRLFSSAAILHAAEMVAADIVDSYNRPVLNSVEGQGLSLDTNVKVDHLKDFTQACREERESLIKQI